MSGTNQSHVVRVGVVGVGAWGANLARNFAELGALAAVCDSDPGVCAAAAEAHGVPGVDDFRALLDDPGIHAVALATPSGTHEGMALAALEAGKDVLVEKPAALDAAGARQLVEAAEAGGRVLMAGHVLRYHPAVEAIVELVEAGELGALRYLHANRLGFGRFGDDGESVLLELGIHDLSLALAIIGKRPERVCCEAGHYLSARTADLATVHLLFENGVRADLHASWLHPFKDQRLVVAGEKGMLVFDDQKPWAEKLVRYDHTVDLDGPRPRAVPAEPRAVELPAEEPLRRECAHFVECVRTRAVPRTDGREALRVLDVVGAAQRSLDVGRAVHARPPAGGATVSEDVFVHPSAVVDGEVEIGAGTKVWHFSKLLGPLKIGEGCSLGQNVVVERNVTLGDNVKIQNNVSVYSGVILEDDVFCGPSMVFTNVGTPRSGYPRKGQYQVTRVKRGASIGANATVVCGHELGRYCFVGAGAVVTRDVPDYALVYGNPARIRGWACFCGVTLPLGTDPDGKERAECPECGRRYLRAGLKVEEEG